MELKTLEYFLSVARHLNFTKAANECYISQAAISQQINKLERELGFPLFRRDNHSVELTPAGQAFAGSAGELLGSYEQAVSNARKLAEGRTGRVKVGILSQYGYGVFSEVLGVYRETYSDVKVDFSYVDCQEVERLLNSGKIDLALGPYWEFSEARNLRVEKLLADSICAVVRKDDPLARGIAGPEELAERDIILFAEKNTPNMHRQVREEWRGYGLDPRRIVAAETFDNILLMVEAGQGLAVLPSRFGGRLNENLRVVELPGSKMMYELAVIRPNRPAKGAGEWFYQTLKNYFRPPK